MQAREGGGCRASPSGRSRSAKGAAPSEVEVLSVAMRALAKAVAALQPFEDEGDACRSAIRSFLALFEGLRESYDAWEERELRCFLDCVSMTPQPKKTGGSAASAPRRHSHHGGLGESERTHWVLDCFVAEKYYEKSHFGRSVYRALRVKATEMGLVQTERRHEGASGAPSRPSRRRSEPETSPKSVSTALKALAAPKDIASTTSVPLLIRLTPSGLKRLRSPLPFGRGSALPSVLELLRAPAPPAAYPGSPESRRGYPSSPPESSRPPDLKAGALSPLDLPIGGLCGVEELQGDEKGGRGVSWAQVVMQRGDLLLLEDAVSVDDIESDEEEEEDKRRKDGLTRPDSLTSFLLNTGSIIALNDRLEKEPIMPSSRTSSASSLVKAPMDPPAPALQPQPIAIVGS